MSAEEAYLEIIRNVGKEDLNSLKLRISKKYKLKKIPTNMELLSMTDSTHVAGFSELIRTKPVRTMSGVAPIAVMTKPLACKHGKCTFCPGGPGSYFGDVPMSYTGNEPSTMRAMRANYDPYLIVFNRLEQYILLNQIPEKSEIIIQGGTFPSFDKEYQEYVVKYIYKAMNDFSSIFFENNKFNFSKFKEFFELPGSVNDSNRTTRIQQKILSIKKECNLEEEQLKNESTNIRCVALVIETKPDWCFSEHINQMLKLGTTRVEIGVQTLYDDILKYTNRGHTVEDIRKSFQYLKDSFLKITAHMMLGLPNSNHEKDINSFRELFSNQDFMPDSLKIYPCLVMHGTPLYELWRQGKFREITEEETYEIISEVKKFIPKFTRIIRIERDIPSTVIAAGIKRTNLRQYIQDYMKQKKIKCKCIRCREPRDRKIDYTKVKLLREYYKSSNGDEIFISAEDVENDILLGFCRLRIPYKPFRREITHNSAGIRELHVYGRAAPIGERNEKYVQHRGYGSLLLHEAEKIAKEEFGMKKILITSGIGVKDYFKKFSYQKDGVYVSKILS